MFILYHRCNNPPFQFLQYYTLDFVTHTLAKLWMPAMLKQFENLIFSLPFHTQTTIHQNAYVFW